MHPSRTHRRCLPRPLAGLLWLLMAGVLLPAQTEDPGRRNKLAARKSLMQALQPSDRGDQGHDLHGERQ